MRGLALLAVVVPLAAQAQAPFCAVTSMGAQCHYWSVEACYQALQGVGGQCVANPAALPSSPPAPSQIAPTQPPPYNRPQRSFLESFNQGWQLGEQMRQAREREKHEEHRYTAPPPVSPGVVYVCQSESDGAYYRTTQPHPGCVVAEVPDDARSSNMKWQSGGW
jgi:hypothetical protein